MTRAFPALDNHRRALYSRGYETRREATGSAAIVAAADQAAGETLPTSAGEFLERVYVHGIPYSHVAGFGPADAARFKAVLANPARKSQWTNASVALGAIGTPEAVESVRGFVRDGRGPLGHDAYQAKLAAVVGLGYGIRRSSSGNALEQLASGCSVDAWMRDLRWSAPVGSSRGDTARALTAASFSGLALSGTAKAADLLTAAAREPTQETRLRKHAESALTQLRKVRKEGLRRPTEPRTL